MNYQQSIEISKMERNGDIKEIIQETTYKNGKLYTRKIVKTPHHRRTYKNVSFAPSPPPIIPSLRNVEDIFSPVSMKIERMPTPFFPPSHSSTKEKRKRRRSLRKKRNVSYRKKN